MPAAVEKLKDKSPCTAAWVALVEMVILVSFEYVLETREALLWSLYDFLCFRNVDVPPVARSNCKTEFYNLECFCAFWQRKTTCWCLRLLRGHNTKNASWFRVAFSILLPPLISPFHIVKAMNWNTVDLSSPWNIFETVSIVFLMFRPLLCLNSNYFVIFFSSRRKWIFGRNYQQRHLFFDDVTKWCMDIVSTLLIFL